MYQSIIINGFRYLKSIQNQDKGIPATKDTGVSGCWTSAETLETLLLSPYGKYELFQFSKEIISFLIDTQIASGVDVGSWPLLKGKDRGSTMATGHTLSALQLARDIFRDDATLLLKINASVKGALTWLNTTQNTDGGWGVEPNDTGDGKSSRIISTVYVLKGYISAGQNCSNSKTVRNAINYIKQLRNEDYGFSGSANLSDSDTCYTARAITALVRTKAFSPNDKYIKQSLSYIVKNRNNRGLWNLDTEPYVPDNSSGQVVYNSNTVADVLEALSVAGRYNKYARKLEEWFVKTQEHDGKWYLGANERTDVTTWSTNEAVYSLICSELYFADVKYPFIMKRIAWYKKAIFSLLAVIAFLMIFPVRIPPFSLLIDLWEQLSEGWRNFIFSTVLMGIIINLFSSSIEKYMPWKRGK